MAPVSIKFVVSFSSQDDNHKVSNIVDNNGFQRWLSHPKEKSGQIEAVFQLEKQCLISFIDVGSVWCANIELQVGKSDWAQGVQYKTLLPTVCLTSPNECKTGQGAVKSRMFSAEHFCTDVSKEKWDRIKVICRQPFRKDVQYGLSFIRIKSATQLQPENTWSLLGSSTDDNKNNATSHSKEKSIVKSIQKHFFGSTFLKTKETMDPIQLKLLKIAGTSENGTEQENALPRTAKLVLAASENMSKFSPQARTKTNSSIKGQLFSERLIQKYGPKFEDEVTDFLGTLQLEDKDLDQITIADMRHKFEKSQKRKLCGDEKKIFMELCQNYICDLFDKSNEISRLPSDSVTGDDNQEQFSTPSRKRKANEDTIMFSPKTPKIGINSVGSCTTNPKSNTINYTPSKLSNCVSSKSPSSSSRIISDKKTHSIEPFRGKTINQNGTPSKSIQMDNLSLMSPTNPNHRSIVGTTSSLQKENDANSNYIHNSPSTNVTTSSTGKKNIDHSRVLSLVQAIKKNFPNSTPSPARKSLTKGPAKKPLTKQGDTKCFAYRGLKLEMGPVNNRIKTPPIKQLVSDIRDSLSGSSDQWMSKEKGISFNNNTATRNLHNSPASASNAASMGRGTPSVRGAKTSGRKSGRGAPNARSRGGSTRKSSQKDKWMGDDMDVCSTEVTVQHPVSHNYVYCSSCKGNVPEHLYSHHYIMCRPTDLSAVSPSSAFNSGVPSLSSTGTSSSPKPYSSLTSNNDIYCTVSSSDSEEDLEIGVRQNSKYVSCPICDQMFSEDVIMVHANFCCETIGF